MNLNETINNILPTELKAKLKSAFMQFAETPVVEEPKKEEVVAMATEVKLLDGNTISVEGELAVGAKVFLVTPEGLVPAPDGEHEAEDGKIYEVLNGVITEIAAKEVESPEAEQVEEMGKMKQELESLKADFKKQQETLALTLSAINKLIETPVAEPIEKKVDFSALSAYQKHKLAKYGKI